LTVPILWLPRAEAELNQILDHIEHESPQRALTMALAILQGANGLLSTYPQAGRIGRIKGTRELVIRATPFIVAYRVRIDRVEILRVIHGKQKFP
jgi:toxin ParE1/3/4